MEEMYNYANSSTCRHKILAAYFQEEIQECETSCDNCKRGEVQEVDITKEAQMFLSAMYRTNQSFGANYIVDILRGSKNKKLLDNRHDKLSVYGIAGDISKASWELIIDKLFEKRAIKRGEYRELLITDFGQKLLKGLEVLKGNPEIFENIQKVSLEADSLTKDENFENLRELRAKIAKKESVPAYIVFSDATLKEMAKKLEIKSSTVLNHIKIISKAKKIAKQLQDKVIQEYLSSIPDDFQKWYSVGVEKVEDFECFKTYIYSLNSIKEIKE